MESHYPYIRETIRLAEAAKAAGNHPFGAVLVYRNEILLRAQNEVVTTHDLAQHPESMVARQAAAQYPLDVLAEATLYASTEPCAMCTGAIYWSGIGQIVFACSAERLYDYASDGLHITCADILAHGDRKIRVIGKVLEDEAAQVHLGFWDNL